MFKASAFEYRHRYLLHGVIYTLGFFAPWNYYFHLDPPGPNAHVWGILSANLARMDIGNIATAFNVLLGIAIVFAFAGAFVRTWGSAYLCANIVQDADMHTAQAQPDTGILQDGPFRFVRNPLYIGTFLHTLAVSLLMPRSGAIFCIVAIALVQLRLIFAEEPFLTAKLGAPYTAYCALVPRLLPTLRPRVKPLGLTPNWPQAFLGEVYMWGVALSFAFTGWRYNAWLVTQCVIVSFGLSLVARAFVTKPAAR